MTGFFTGIAAIIVLPGQWAVLLGVALSFLVQYANELRKHDGKLLHSGVSEDIFLATECTGRIHPSGAGCRQRMAGRFGRTIARSHR